MKGMTVGVCVIELYLPRRHSLKDKRRILQSLKSRIKNRFNVAVAEVGEQNLWQKAVIGVTTLSNDRRRVNEVLDKVVGLVAGTPEAEIVHRELELI